MVRQVTHGGVQQGSGHKCKVPAQGRSVAQLRADLGPGVQNRGHAHQAPLHVAQQPSVLRTAGPMTWAVRTSDVLSQRTHTRMHSEVQLLDCVVMSVP